MAILVTITHLQWHLTLLAVQHRAVLLLLVTKLEMLRPLDRLHVLLLALRALELQSDLLRRLGLLAEDRLRLPAEALLLRVVPALPLGHQGRLPRLVLRHLLRGVLVALLAIRVASLRDAHHARLRPASTNGFTRASPLSQ